MPDWQVFMENLGEKQKWECFTKKMASCKMNLIISFTEVIRLNYEQIVNYIEEIPKFTVKNPPEHTKELLRRLGNPQDLIKIIHVAGTNGKGSTCAYLASMLKEGGFRTGLFTSPHLVKINDRFRINGENISDEDFAESFLNVKKVIEEAKTDGFAHPSYFETLFLMGIDYFYRKKVDYLVLETGLGGGKDPTNCVEHPLACIITSISIDHVQYLGDTIQAIASEKAGIIKPGVPIIYDGHVKEAAGVIEARAKELDSPAYALKPEQYGLKKQSREGIVFTFEGETLQIPYIAEYQMMNASLAYFTMKKLQKVHGISDEVLKEGIKNVTWAGRMETVLPGVIVDGAHNADGVAQFVKTVRQFRENNRLILLFSAVSDKEYEKMIRLICEEIDPDAVVTTQIQGERQVLAEDLAGLFEKHGAGNVTAVSASSHALEKALELQQDGMVFCVGSLYLIGEIKAYLEKRQA